MRIACHESRWVHDPCTHGATGTVILCRCRGDRLRSPLETTACQRQPVRFPDNVCGALLGHRRACCYDMAFVEVPADRMEAVIAALHKTTLRGRRVRVQVTRPAGLA